MYRKLSSWGGVLALHGFTLVDYSIVTLHGEVHRKNQSRRAKAYSDHVRVKKNFSLRKEPHHALRLRIVGSCI